MTRKEVFIRGLAMVNRIEELKAKYGWKEEDLSNVRGSIGPLPVLLHFAGLVINDSTKKY